MRYASVFFVAVACQSGTLPRGNRSQKQPATAPVAKIAAQAMALSNDRTCALLTDGVRCWGGDDVAAALIAKAQDARFLGKRLSPPEPLLGIDAASWMTCGFSASAVYCWWGTPWDAAETYPPGFRKTVMPGGITKIAVGNSHVCTLNRGGQVHCAGENHFGQLGQGHKRAATGAQRVKLPGAAQDIAANQRFTCAIVGGKVHCWGDDQSGQLGPNTEKLAGPTFDIPGVLAATQLALTEDAGCALVAGGGSLRCWGHNESNVRGPDKQSQVTTVAFSRPIIDLAAGMGHMCAVDVAGYVHCWGLNFFGALGVGIDGRGTDVGDDESPGDVPPVEVGAQALRIFSGGNHNCVVVEGGRVRCWGDDGQGQLGDNGYLPDKSPSTAQFSRIEPLAIEAP